MPVDPAILQRTRAAADQALAKKAITPEVHAALTDGEITPMESAKATFTMAKKSLFAGASRRAACTALAKAIEEQMAAQD